MRVGKWDAIGKLRGSPLRKTVLLALKDKKLTPLELQKATDIKFSHISTKLTGLCSDGLVELLTSKKIRKGKIYGITNKGRVALTKI